MTQAGIQSELTRERICAAEQAICPYIRRTPVLEIDGADFGIAGVTLVLKLELFQHSGSFKARGAFANMVLQRVPEAGVAAASGGNHGAAVAYAASKLGHKATIFVPTVASASKLRRIESYGAKLVVTGERYDDALAASRAWLAESGALDIHAYESIVTLLGQGTLGYELQQQDAHLDTLLVAVGGGGLIGGIAAWYRGDVKLAGVEPEAAPTLSMALDAGRPVNAPTGGIAADSLAPVRVGELMFPLAQQFVSHVMLVSDGDIRRAQQALWGRAQIAAEPGGAAAFAALLSGRYKPQPGERVGVVVCGANTDAVRFE